MGLLGIRGGLGDISVGTGQLTKEMTRMANVAKGRGRHTSAAYPDKSRLDLDLSWLTYRLLNLLNSNVFLSVVSRCSHYGVLTSIELYSKIE